MDDESDGVKNNLKRKKEVNEVNSSQPAKRAFETVYYDVSEEARANYTEFFVIIDLMLEDKTKRLNDLVLYESLNKLNLLKGIIEI